MCDLIARGNTVGIDVCWKDELPNFIRSSDRHSRKEQRLAIRAEREIIVITSRNRLGPNYAHDGTRPGDGGVRCVILRTYRRDRVLAMVPGIVVGRREENF